MGTEITRLDCVEGTSVEEVRAALGTPPRRLSIYGERGWVVVVDEDRLSDMNWAEMLSRTLARRAIAIRAYADYGDLRIVEYDRGAEVNAFTIDEDTERDDDEFVSIAVPFLGIELEAGGSADDIAVAIAEAAGLPRPLSRYDHAPEHAIELEAAEEASGPGSVREGGAGQAREGGAQVGDGGGADDDVGGGDASADELAAFGAFLEREPAAARGVRTEYREPELPALPGRLHDRNAFQNFLGRQWAVGRSRWPGFSDPMVDVLIALADGFVGNYGSNVLGVDLRLQHRPVRVGGRLAPSTKPRGATIWETIRANLGGEARLHLRGAEFVFERDIRLGETRLEWSGPLPPHPPMVAAFSACFDRVIRRAVEIPGIIEAFITPQAEPREPAYLRMCGVRTGLVPGWRTFVPGEGLIASDAISPYAMTADEMNVRAKQLLPKQKR